MVEAHCAIASIYQVEHRLSEWKSQQLSTAADKLGLYLAAQSTHRAHTEDASIEATLPQLKTTKTLLYPTDMLNVFYILELLN